MSCSQCESLPAPLSGPGHLHLILPPGHVFHRFQKALQSAGWEFHLNEDVVVVFAPEASLSSLGTFLMGALSSVEQAESRAVFQQEGKPFRPSDFLRSNSVREFIATTQSAWLRSMLDRGGLRTHFQPIVSSADKAPFAYECLTRGADNGALIPPMQLFDLARHSGLLYYLDLAARRTAIITAANQNIRQKLFINFTPSSVYDPAFCLRSTVAAVNEAGLRHDQVVFEVIESEKVRDMAHLKGILNFYRQAGFKVALDDLGSGYSSLSALVDLRPDFVKIDSHLIKEVDGDAYKQLLVAKLIETAKALGIAVIAEGVETEGEFAKVRELGADYQQGYLFGRPQPTAAVPARALSASA